MSALMVNAESAIAKPLAAMEIVVGNSIEIWLEKLQFWVGLKQNISHTHDNFFFSFGKRCVLRGIVEALAR